jgi:hypothetical protein
VWYNVSANASGGGGGGASATVVRVARQEPWASVVDLEASVRAALSEGGAVVSQTRIPLGEQNDVWAESDAGFVVEGDNMHAGHIIVLEWAQVMIGAVPLRAGRHYYELELLENSLVPGVMAGDPVQHSGPSTARFGVVCESPATRGAGLAPHALWEPAAVLNTRSPWAEFTDGLGRKYYLRDQSSIETAEQDEAQHVQVDDTEQMIYEPTGAVAAAVDPTFASEERVLEALS